MWEAHKTHLRVCDKPCCTVFWKAAFHNCSNNMLYKTPSGSSQIERADVRLSVLTWFNILKDSLDYLPNGLMRARYFCFFFPLRLTGVCMLWLGWLDSSPSYESWLSSTLALLGRGRLKKFGSFAKPLIIDSDRLCPSPCAALVRYTNKSKKCRIGGAFMFPPYRHMHTHTKHVNITRTWRNITHILIPIGEDIHALPTALSSADRHIELRWSAYVSCTCYIMHIWLRFLKNSDFE